MTGIGGICPRCALWLRRATVSFTLWIRTQLPNVGTWGPSRSVAIYLITNGKRVELRRLNIVSALYRTHSTLNGVFNTLLHVILVPRALIDACSYGIVPLCVFPRAVYVPRSDIFVRTWLNHIRTVVDSLSAPFDTHLKSVARIWIVVFQ